jgi:hypothetical protein
MADIAPAPFLSSRPPAAPGDRAVEACVLVSRAVEARVLGAFGSGPVRSGLLLGPPVSGSVSLPWQSWTRAPTWLASRYRPKLNRDRPVPIRRRTRPQAYVSSPHES